jgi:hypothetical protein
MPSVAWIAGPDPIVVPAQEGTGQSYKAGDLVKWSSGQLVIATGGAIDGIARRDASGTASTVCEVELINLDAVYLMTYGTTTSQAVIGSTQDITFTAGGHTTVTGGSGNDGVVVALDPRDAVGTSGGRVYFQFKPGATLKA